MPAGDQGRQQDDSAFSRLEALLPPLLFALILLAAPPLWQAYQLGFDEGLNLMKGALVSEGFSLYSEIWNDQPPLLTFILAATHRAFPFSVEHARLVILAFSGLLLWALFRSVRLLEGRAAAWLAVLALMAMAGFQVLSVAVLVGLPAVALATAALQQVLAGASDNKNWHYWGAGVLFALALQTKLFVAILLPSIVLAVFVRLDGSGQLATWQMRAPKLAHMSVSALAVFLLIAVIVGEPAFELIAPHYQARSSWGGGWAPAVLLKPLLWRNIPAIVLVLFVVGLIVAVRRIRPTRLVPVVWLICAALTLSFHRPLSAHHYILLYPPIAWIAALAIQAVHQEFSRRVVAAICVALIGIYALWTALDWGPNASIAGDHQKKMSADGRRSVALLQASPADRWVFADNVMDAYRARRLIPPELAVWSAKRLNTGFLTSDALIAAAKRRRPDQLLFRRFRQPQPFLDSLSPAYTELPSSQQRTTEDSRHYVQAGNPMPRDPLETPAGQALLTATNALRPLSNAGGFSGLYDQRTRKAGRTERAEYAGEGRILARPPGSTQDVGQCFLRAYSVTGAALFWDAAKDAGQALACAQGRNGGWASVAHLTAACDSSSDKREGDEQATLDEGASQSALLFLMELAGVYATKPTPSPVWLEESIRKGIQFLLLAQKESGGWPQRYPSPKDTYADHVTLNDGVTSEAINALLRAHQAFGDQRYLDAAMRGGDFLVKAQGPASQPAWAQQYDADNRPAPARIFEPAALASEETGFAMNALLDLFVATRDERFLTGLDAARDWLLRSTIRPGIWARLYEIGTNRPIYGDRDGKVHYSLDELSEERRSGYRWESAFASVVRALERYGALQEGGIDGLERYTEATRRDERRRLYREALPLVPELASSVRPGEGWVEDGKISMRTFVANCKVLLNAIEFADNEAE